MFTDLIVQFSTLAGVAAFIAALVNVAKTFGLPDGYAPKVSAGFSLVAFIALVSLKIFKPEIDVTGLDKWAAELGVLVLYVLGLVAQLGLPAKFHEFLSNSRVPVVGKSYSLDAWDAD
jgi:hypothetical protein